MDVGRRSAMGPRPALGAALHKPPSHSAVGSKRAIETTRAVMVHARLPPAGERIIEPMLDLAHCSKLNGIIVTGANSTELMSELQRRGYVRVATTANCGVAAGQYDVALIDWRRQSIQNPDTTPPWRGGFLYSRGDPGCWG